MDNLFKLTLHIPLFVAFYGRSLVLIILPLLFLPGHVLAQPLDQFLNEYGLEVEKSHIQDQIRNYLNPKLKKQALVWYKGSLRSNEQEDFDNLDVKFNTFSNSLYVRYKGKIYSISSSGIAEFTLQDELNKRRFVKGFGKLHQYRISTVFDLDPLLLITYLTQYPRMSDFHIREFSTHELALGGNEMVLLLEASEKNAVKGLQSYLKELDAIEKVDLQMENSPFNKNIFYEMLVEEETFAFLKLNHKRISSYDSNALARHSSAISFDDSSYYMSNLRGEIQELKFMKRSLLKALNFARIKPPSKIPSIRNEKQMVNWLLSLKEQ